MCTLFVRAVGHGACMAMEARGGPSIYVDCGSRESAPWAAEEYLRLGERVGRAGAFFLSHFYYDHYNGLVWLAEQDGGRRVPIDIGRVSGCPDGCWGVAQGDTVRKMPGEWTVLWPPRDVRLDGPYGKAMQDGYVTCTHGHLALPIWT